MAKMTQPDLSDDPDLYKLVFNQLHPRRHVYT